MLAPLQYVMQGGTTSAIKKDEREKKSSFFQACLIQGPKPSGAIQQEPTPDFIQRTPHKVKSNDYESPQR